MELFTAGGSVSDTINATGNIRARAAAAILAPEVVVPVVIGVVVVVTAYSLYQNHDAIGGAATDMLHFADKTFRRGTQGHSRVDVRGQR